MILLSQPYFVRWCLGFGYMRRSGRRLRVGGLQFMMHKGEGQVRDEIKHTRIFSQMRFSQLDWQKYHHGTGMVARNPREMCSNLQRTRRIYGLEMVETRHDSATQGQRKQIRILSTL